MLVTIHLDQIKAKVLVGAFEEERHGPQPITIDLALTYDSADAVKSDALVDAFDYYDLTTRLIAAIEQTDFILLERLVDYVLEFVTESPRITHAKVKVAKPEVLGPMADCVSISAEKSR